MFKLRAPVAMRALQQEFNRNVPPMRQTSQLAAIVSIRVPQRSLRASVVRHAFRVSAARPRKYQIKPFSCAKTKRDPDDLSSKSAKVLTQPHPVGKLCQNYFALVFPRLSHAKSWLICRELCQNSAGFRVATRRKACGINRLHQRGLSPDEARKTRGLGNRALRRNPFYLSHSMWKSLFRLWRSQGAAERQSRKSRTLARQSRTELQANWILPVPSINFRSIQDRKRSLRARFESCPPNRNAASWSSAQGPSG